MRHAAKRAVAIGALLLALVIAGTFAPVVLRVLPMFRIERVEVTGVRHMSPEAAAEAAGITRGESIFADPTPWLDSLAAHPLVAAVSIGRKLPHTIVLRIEETQAVAFARTPELRAIGANGRILPADPRRIDMDLPVLAVRTKVSGHGEAIDAQTLDIVRFLEIAAHFEPGLIGWISEIGMHGEAIRLVLRNTSDAEVLIPVEPSPARLRELHLTLGELASHDGEPGTRTELSNVKRIDVRYADQITVTLYRGKS